MIFQKYGSGKMLTGELKQELIKVLQNHLLKITLYCRKILSMSCQLTHYITSMSYIDKHIVLCFVLIFFLFCTLCCQFRWINQIK
jgi:hypothetical protein